MARKLYFITGGARSGKSSFAEHLAERAGGHRAYIAAAQAIDPEMVQRIARHRERRGAAWDTFEEPLAVEALLRRLNGRYDVVLFDCVTLWLSNVMARSAGDDEVLQRAAALAESLRAFTGTCIVVSNEVGLGIVPDNPVARRFRDLAGLVNQALAQTSDEAYLMTAGIPMKIK